MVFKIFFANFLWSLRLFDFFLLISFYSKEGEERLRLQESISKAKALISYLYNVKIPSLKVFVKQSFTNQYWRGVGASWGPYAPPNHPLHPTYVESKKIGHAKFSKLIRFANSNSWKFLTHNQFFCSLYALDYFTA